MAKQVNRDGTTGVSKGYGFVSFKHPPSATMALQHMNGVNLMGPFQGRAIKVGVEGKGRRGGGLWWLINKNQMTPQARVKAGAA